MTSISSYSGSSVQSTTQAQSAPQTAGSDAVEQTEIRKHRQIDQRYREWSRIINTFITGFDIISDVLADKAVNQVSSAYCLKFRPSTAPRTKAAILKNSPNQSQPLVLFNVFTSG